MFSLKGRVALVTGSGRGIGRAIALALAQQGAGVGVTARTPAELDEVVTTVGAAGGRALAIVADLTAADAPAQILARMNAALGPVEILVNNAGIGSSAHPLPRPKTEGALSDRTLSPHTTPPDLVWHGVHPSVR